MNSNGSINGQKHSRDDPTKMSRNIDNGESGESDDCSLSSSTSSIPPNNFLQMKITIAMPPPAAVAAISPPSPSRLEGPTSSSQAEKQMMSSMNRRRCRLAATTTTAATMSSAFNHRKPPPLPATPVRIALDMRTRSSRLFFVLLHLVGVSTNVPSHHSSTFGTHSTSTSSSSSNLRSPWWLNAASFWSSYSYGGIVGVQPSAILLERLDIQSSRRGLKGIIDRVERVYNWDAEVDLLGEPYWFQDNTDGLCLGPGGGFSECGDATLWRIRRRPLTKRQSLRERKDKTLRQDRWRREQQLQNEKSSTQSEDGDRSQNFREGGMSSVSTSPTMISSTVCVWPFFCEKNSQVSQPIHNMEYYDEVYGFAYHENHHSTHEDYETDDGFALQLTDVDAMTANASFSHHYIRTGGKSGSRRRQKREFFWNTNHGPQSSIDPQDDCLLSIAPSNYHGVDDSGGISLEIGSCSSEAAFVWHVNRDGILVRKATKAERRKRKRGRWNISPKRASAFAVGGVSGSNGLQQSAPSDYGCVHRTNSTFATVMPCGDVDDALQQSSDSKSVVEFSLVRYPSTLSKILPPRGLFGDDVNNNVVHTSSWEPWTTLVDAATTNPAHDNTSQTLSTDVKGGSTLTEQNIMPTSRTSSQHHASTDAKHRHSVDLKSTASMLHTSLEQGKLKNGVVTSASHIRHAPIAMNGVAFHNQFMSKVDDGIDLGSPMKGYQTSSSSTKPPQMNKSSSLGQTPIHDKSTESRGGVGGVQHGAVVDSNNPHRPRKIPVHPYIQSSHDFVWVDPLTSLEYPTDLCQYLGQTKKEAGRHTLMGVGQYYRTAFNIKVYGAALYVAKRDVLADPKFGEYATLSAEELRNRGDFYDLFMNMPSPGEDPSNSIGGLFDRTLFVKINMQLSLEAMRKSLEADWSLLTDEMKSLIINSSFKERVADDRMQQKILSKENSSNCSCGQVAPPEYSADPSCCARGTELVFTWRKNGDFEIRLDGRVMDIFPRPDIAKGIFSEYMNVDPISRDAKAHFTDGFPFLLAPLAQVKGMTSAVPHAQNQIREVTGSSTNPMRRLMGVAIHSMDSMNSQAHSLSKWVLDSAAGVSSNAMGSAMCVARGLSEELDRQRIEFIETAVALQKDGFEMLSSLVKLSAVGDALALTIANQGTSTLSPFSNGYDTYYQENEVVTDEIGIKIGPTMNFTHRLFFTTVHVYLLLLLVVSIPGSNNTRLVVKRRILETKKFVESSHGAFVAINKLH